jgi:long-chain acyl-CoA synthetase
MLPGVPPIYKALSDSPSARTSDLRSIRVCVSGAMRLPGEVQEQFERITGGRLVEGYGMTEASPTTHCNPLSGLRKTGSIGVPLPGTRAKVVDADDATHEFPVGTAGELAVAGPQVFRGYWGADDADGLFTDDGYLLTGDIAVMDEDGFFTVVDRKKELIIAGGFNIYPSEVEEVLLSLPGVADAVVVGVPDRYRGETVKAFVVREPGATVSEQDVVEHCATQLTAYKVPKLVEFREALPRTVVGKVLRRVLLEQERARLAEQEAAQEKPGSVPSSIARRRAAVGPDPEASAGGAARRKAAAAPAAKSAAAKTAAAKAPAKKAPATKAPAKKAPTTKAPAGGTAAAKAPATKAAAATTSTPRATSRKNPPPPGRSGAT